MKKKKALGMKKGTLGREGVSGSFDVGVSVKAEVLPIPSTVHADLILYRLTRTERRRQNGRMVAKKDTFFSGVTTRKDVQDVLGGKKASPGNVTKTYKALRSGYQPRTHIVALSNDYIEYLRCHGFGGLSTYQGASAVSDPLNEDPSTYTVVEFDGGSHQLWDLERNPLPVGHHFNYIEGGFANDRYDLRRAAEILLARKDVTLHPDGGERVYGDWLDKGPDSYIGEIPHYNRDRRRTRCLSFVWAPSTEDYRKVLAAAGNEWPTSWEFVRACLDVDVFGLRAGGALLRPDGSSVRSDLDDDDAPQTDEG